MSGKTYGYVYIADGNQKGDAQKGDAPVAAMRELGLDMDQIIVEKQPEKHADRPLYQNLIGRLQPGDALVIHSLDSLGADYAEIREQWRVLRKERGVTVIVLDIPLLSTREDQEPFDEIITDLVLQFFDFLVKVQTRREKNRARQRRK